MKNFLRILAVLVVLAAGATWLATGTTIGWTKTSVAVKTLDPVTEIEGITYQKKFIAGLDFLGGAAAVAAGLAGASFFFRNNKQTQTTNK